MLRSTLTVLAVLSALVWAGASGHYSMGPTGRYVPEPLGNARTLSFSSGWEFDTRTGEPALPAELRQVEGDAGAEYWIVQLEGPFERQWLRRFERLGLEPFGYLPNYAVLCRMTPAERAAVEALPFVVWTGLYQPAYKLEPGLDRVEGEVRLVALLMPGAEAAPVIDLVSGLGGRVDLLIESPIGVTVELTAGADAIPALARAAEVLWLQVWSEPTTCNNSAQWVTQTGWRSSAPPDTSLAARRAWGHGVRGQGLILSATDTGLNVGHDMFRDPDMPVTAPGIWPGHRKVAAFKLYQGANAGESQYHGSHVNGTIAGNDSATGGTSYYDGMAIDARLYFVDVTSATGSFVIPTNFYTVWDTVYHGRGLPDSVRPIRQHSGSWGWANSQGTYLIQDASTDAFAWEFKDFLNIMAAGNESSTRRLRNPGIAKNVLTVGATQNGTSSNLIASFSSRGPTQDGRTKPNVVAPGVDLWSANRTGTNTYTQMSGTSMATPAVNGAVGLLRCYLEQGYYPTGTPMPGDRIGYISAALMRSMAMVSGDPNVGSYTVPDNNIGWGRIDADSVLYFPGDTRRLIIVDDTVGLATGEYKEYQFEVSSAIPLRAMLAWTDTAAAPSANPTLVNDLDLKLVAPSGTEYRGNRFASGQSQPDPATWDSINVEEGFRVNSPELGVWTIWVGARNVATAAKQPFAWTITGDVAPTALDHDVAALAIIAPAGQVDSGTVVVPQAIIANRGIGPEIFDVEFTVGAWADTQSVSLAAGATDTVEFAAWTAQAVGWFEARVKTMLAGDENPANDVRADSFEVLPLTGIAGGGVLPREFSLEGPVPNPTTGRTLVRFAVPQTAAAQVGVYAVDGTLVRMLVDGTQRPGRYGVTWDGRDAGGRQTSRGIYYVRMTAPGFTGVQKLVRVQ
ncbi:MAG: S8 family serine peptidase [bacterium]